ADPFEEEAVQAHLASRSPSAVERHLECGCPSTAVQTLERSSPVPQGPGASALGHWPVQLRLVPVKAPFFEGVDLLVAADCVPFAYPDLHGTLLRGRSLVIGCPKFDDARSYARKLGEILRLNDVRSVTVAHMEVPCCHGLRWVVDRAVEASGKSIPVRHHVFTVEGGMT
ncbi:MAG: 4Fe-4S ferredoxin, partial [Candidatus Bathyarchaeia archaeon]